MATLGSQPITVLHVDDETDFVEMTAAFLERGNERITVETALSASDGLAELSENNLDCVVSDYDMPGQTGIEFLQSVRLTHPDLPFILFTGKGSEEVASEAISAGATDYLQKGGTERYALLANRIQNAVEQYRNRQRRARLERIRTVVNHINQALIRAASRQDIETQVCNVLADAEPYRFAVIAEVDPGTLDIEPTTWAGSGEDFLSHFEMSVAEETPGRQAPAGRAFHDREIAVTQHIRHDPAYEQWRERALDHGFEALAAVPLEYEAEFHGLLAVFAGEPNAFDATEQQVLSELGDDIAHAMEANDLQNELRSEKERFRLLAESARVAIVMIDTDSRVRFANSAIEAIFGYAPDELVGEPLTKLMPERYRERHRAAVTQFLETRERTLDWSYIEFPGLQKNDEEIDLSISFAEFKQDGEQLFEGIIRDDTERKNRERELEQYRTIADTIRDGICVLTRNSEIVMVNKGFVELTAYSRDELIGSHASLVRPAALNERFVEIQNALDAGSPMESIEMEIELPDGSTRLIEARYAPYSHEDVEGRVGVWRDITEARMGNREFGKS